LASVPHPSEGKIDKTEATITQLKQVFVCAGLFYYRVHSLISPMRFNSPGPKSLFDLYFGVKNPAPAVRPFVPNRGGIVRP
jgi:hypothetical protein